MDPRTSQFRAEIRAVCRDHGVARLDLLRAVEPADGAPVPAFVEFVVVYPDDRDLGPWLAGFFALQEELSGVLGRRVRLALATPIRDAWLAHTQRQRLVVYDARSDPVVRSAKVA